MQLSKAIVDIDAEMGVIDEDSLEISSAEMTEYVNVGRVEYLNAAMAVSFEKRTEVMDLKIESSRRKVAPQLRTGAKENEGQECEQSSDINEAEYIEPSQMFGDVLKLFRFLILFLGIRISYGWIPRKYFVCWVYVVALLFTIFTLFYTAHYHYTNENYVRMLEPAGLSGITISVKKN